MPFTFTDTALALPVVTQTDSASLTTETAQINPSTPNPTGVDSFAFTEQDPVLNISGLSELPFLFSDTALVTVSFAVTDAFTFAELLAQITTAGGTSVADADAFGMVDSPAVIIVLAIPTDSGTVTDRQTVTALVIPADAATLSEPLPSLTAKLNDLDSAIFTEVLAVVNSLNGVALGTIGFKHRLHGSLSILN